MREQASLDTIEHMLKRTIMCITAASFIVGGCQTAYDRNSEEVPPLQSQTVEAGASEQRDAPENVETGDTANLDTVQDSSTEETEPAQTESLRTALTERQLREFVFSREDFPYEWVSESSTTDGVFDDTLLAINERYESCLGVETGTLQPVAELESDSFTSDGSFEVSSSVSQYVSSDVAQSEFDAMGTTSGRECFRQALRDAISYEFAGTDLTVSDVYVVECEAVFETGIPEMCLLTDIFIQGGDVGADGVSLVLETYGFLRDDVVVSVSMLSPGSIAVGEEELFAASAAVYQLLDRFATYTMT